VRTYIRRPSSTSEAVSDQCGTFATDRKRPTLLCTSIHPWNYYDVLLIMSSRCCLTDPASARPRLFRITCPTNLLSTFFLPERNAAASWGKSEMAAWQSFCSSSKGLPLDGVSGAPDVEGDSAIRSKDWAILRTAPLAGSESSFLRSTLPDVPAKGESYWGEKAYLSYPLSFRIGRGQ